MCVRAHLTPPRRRRQNCRRENIWQTASRALMLDAFPASRGVVAY